MPISRVRLTNFTAFDSLDFEPTDGLNVLVGANGTGKTHLMKVAYAASYISKTGEPFVDKLVSVFLPSGRQHGRLVRRRQGVQTCKIRVDNGERSLQTQFTSKSSDSIRYLRRGSWHEASLSSAYIPVKEVLAGSPGFLSLYESREIHFEETYRDILLRASVPSERGPIPRERKRLLEILRQAMSGKVNLKNEEFFLRNRHGNLEFSLLAEGHRKLGLLWLLIRNGTLLNGSVLFWDEPETNLNPALFEAVVRILLELQRNGVQIFIATHDYVILKEVDLQMTPTDNVRFHALHDDGGTIEVNSVDRMIDIEPNVILQTFSRLYDREIDRSLR